jgi:hypothetical protein
MKFRKCTPVADPLEKWHRWFAWFPVTVEHRLGEEILRYTYWMETVMRRRECFGGYDGVYCRWFYEIEPPDSTAGKI